jgi:phosphatidylglycerophosphate synthase
VGLLPFPMLWMVIWPRITIGQPLSVRTLWIQVLCKNSRKDDLLFFDSMLEKGTYLDPISDKVVINGLAISLWYSGLLPTPIILLWGGKDATLLSGTAYLLHKKYNSINFFTTSLTEKPLTVTPSTVAKANTALQFLTIGVAIVTPVATSFPPMLLESLWCAFFFGGLVARFTPYTVLFLLLASIYFALFSWITGASTIGSSFSYMSKTGFRVDDAIGKEKKENGEASKKGTTR